jgi:hypothetical protein
MEEREEETNPEEEGLWILSPCTVYVAEIQMIVASHCFLEFPL